jgi:hypothetical protein
LINEELKGDDHKPTHLIRLTLKNDYQGLAMASDGQITASVKYFKANPDDVGAIVFETVCCAQNYGSGGKSTWLAQVIAEHTWLANRGANWQAWLPESSTPGLLPWDATQFSAVLKAFGAYFASSTEGKGRDSKWLVEGIADYVRFFKYEPGKLQPLDPDRARYNKHSQDTAAFLAYLTQAYDKDIVRKLNQIVQKGKYRDEAFQALTGRTIRELGEEWRASLRRDRKLAAAPAAPG